jgi:vanillate O-demethylase monooxygenase subunit
MFLPVDTAAPSLRPADSGISKNDWQVLASFWYPVALVKEVEDAPFSARLLDVDLVLYRSGGGITAAVDMCPHRWVRLSAGTVEGGEITCPFHGLTFDGAGQCTRVPALGRAAKLPASYRVRTFRTQQRYGMIWVCLDDESREDLPTYPALDGYDESAMMFAAVWQWPMSAARQIENFVDLAHLPFIHATTLGGDQNARIAPAKVEQRPKSVMLNASFVETVPFDEPTECLLSYEIFLPFGINFTSTPVGGTGFSSVNIASPTTAHSTRVFQVMARGEPGQVFEEDKWSLPSNEGGPGVINQQDIDILEHLAIHDMPLTEKLEIHLPVDNVSTAYRQRLRELGLGRS